MTEIDKIIFKNSVVMLLLFTFTNASKGLRNLTLSVYPEVIRRGQSAQLHCNYEVFDVPLYSVKWYRGIFEFYRYTPFEHPPGKTFFFNTGIKVDLSVSNASHVTLRNVDFNLNGNVSCEVTTESPSFYTATATSVLQVVELPHLPPTLWTEFTKYDPGDILRANCSTQPSKPSATITFLLNQYAVGNEPTMYHPTADNNLFWSSKNLLIQILPSHYQNGHLILRCTAEVGTFYADYTEAFLETTRKEPIPERVTSFSKGHAVKSSCEKRIYVVCVLLSMWIFMFVNSR
ncbi:uncharacterized protein [Chironomus tepperi]|uniref:uncharacterized protein n=1 Tax=Chironomus tepperi TaxID=113505 RepID=UPI00391FB6B1